MPEFQTGILRDIEIPSLIALQSDNMIDRLTKEQSASQGFLTFRYNETFIKEMLKDLPQPVARDGEQLAGYALATSVRAACMNPLTKPMVDVCGQIMLNGQALSSLSYYIMGQICVKEGYRGMGIFDALYAEHKKRFAATHDYLITEISQQNHRSMAAHARVGFQTIRAYNDGTTDWNVVVWDFK